MTHRLSLATLERMSRVRTNSPLRYVEIRDERQTMPAERFVALVASLEAWRLAATGCDREHALELVLEATRVIHSPRRRDR